jgi:LPPG:FO 2-phospho-L-lactate transferase
MIAVLAGGTGAAKFIRGLVQVVPQEDLAIVVNTGDDLDWWGLRVCPDIDTTVYCLAGMLDLEKGWGVSDDTFACRDQMSDIGEPTWFNVGDRDLAVHLLRTRLLREGMTLTEATRRIAKNLDVIARVLPMSDQPVRTIVHTPEGELSFQEFFVRDRWRPDVIGVEYRSDPESRPSEEVLAAIAQADAIIVAPSNPITSIGPILSLRGNRVALAEAKVPVAAITPIVGGQAVSGPAGKLMGAAGYMPSAISVAAIYREFLDVLVSDSVDSGSRHEIESLGVRPCFTDTIMSDVRSARRLADEVMRFIFDPVRSSHV